MRLVLIASPFVGGVAWAGVAAELPDALAADYGGVDGPDWFEGVARRVSAQAGARPWVAVLHSGAGAFAPALADAAHAPAGFLFVDAGLPTPGRSALELAPPEFGRRLRERTRDGKLEPWSTWFDEDPTQRMIPDPTARAAFVAAQPRAPFAFLEAPCAGSDAWIDRPSGYLQFSRAYVDQADAAEARGWPVLRLRTHHLAMVSDPRLVAREIESLVKRLA